MKNISHDTLALRTQTIDGFTVEFHDSGFGVGTLLTGFSMWREWDFRSKEAQLIRHEVEILTMEELEKAAKIAKNAIKQCSTSPRKYLYKKMEGKNLRVCGSKMALSEWV